MAVQSTGLEDTFAVSLWRISAIPVATAIEFARDGNEGTRHMTAPCPLCSGRHPERLFDASEFMLHRKSYTLVRCTGCSHVYLSSPPDPDELSEFYVEVVPRLRATYPPNGTTTAESLADSPFEREKIELIRDGGLLEPSGSVLDIGFGEGGFLVAMARQGWQCTGVELTDEVELQIDPSGWFEAYFGDRALEQLTPEQYDLITMWHVLEHLKDPVSTLRQARRLLKPGGRILVAVPNFGGLSARAFGPYWEATMPPWHLQQFNPRSLGLALCEAGFSLSEVRGFGDAVRGSLCGGSVTQLIDRASARWHYPVSSALLRLLRRSVVVGRPFLLFAERVLGMPGAMVAIGTGNPLVQQTSVS